MDSPNRILDELDEQDILIWEHVIGALESREHVPVLHNLEWVHITLRAYLFMARFSN